MIVKSIMLSCWYLFHALFSKKKLLRDEHVELVVSMTTYGYRLNFVFLTIESILCQNYMPCRIVLYICDNEIKNKKIPWILRRQVSRGVEVVVLDEDYKSYKKLSYIYKELKLNPCDNERFIVTADDDVFYPKCWLEGFSKHYKYEPNKVYCYRGRIISFRDNDNVETYTNWLLADEHNTSNQNNFLMPTGVSGVCYPLSSLSSEVCDFQAISQICPSADDVWYKLVTTKNEVQSQLVGRSSSHFVPIITGYIKGLEKVNVGEDRNTTQFESSLSYFNMKENSFLLSAKF